MGLEVVLDVNPVIGIKSATDIRSTLSAPLKPYAFHISITGIIVNGDLLTVTYSAQLWKNIFFVMNISRLEVETLMASFTRNGGHDYYYHHLPSSGKSHKTLCIISQLKKAGALSNFPHPSLTALS